MNVALNAKVVPTPTDRIKARKATICIVGLGYVGIPLASAALEVGYRVIGIDVDAGRVNCLNEGRSPLKSFPTARIKAMVATNRFQSTTDFDALVSADAILICVPTPVSKHREPDLSLVTSACRSIAPRLTRGQLVVLESTVYPGTTKEIVKPTLEASGLKAGEDFFLAYSPEREDPGNKDFSTRQVPRVVGADDPVSQELAVALYSQIVSEVVEVSSTSAAEAVKITENVFRSVNIGLVNELKIIYRKMGIDIWEVIRAASSKPYGYMPFYPGPGIGGHCIPVDPLYLSWKAREYGMTTHFINLADEVNVGAPVHVVNTLAESLGERQRKSLYGARILVVGLAYKKDVDDIRESPSLRVIELLEQRGADVEYFDPLIPVVTHCHELPSWVGRESVALNAGSLNRFDGTVICTDHSGVAYDMLVKHVPLVVDTRNVTQSLDPSITGNVIRI